jgi:hypothetical protein
VKSRKSHIEDFEKIVDEDLTSLEQAGQKEFVNKLKANRKKAAKALKVFAKDLGNEAKETKEASKILVKFIAEGKVSPEEEKELKTQVYDLFKMVGIGIPFFMIPGSSLLLPFLIKISSKYGINILPTSFNHKNEEE